MAMVTGASAGLHISIALIRVDAVAEIWLIAVDLGVSSSRMPGGRVKRGRAITTGRRAADERYTTIA
jgi:hypothetical protein